MTAEQPGRRCVECGDPIPPPEDGVCVDYDRDLFACSQACADDYIDTLAERDPFHEYDHGEGP